jgi:hypothetical protein
MEFEALPCEAGIINNIFLPLEGGGQGGKELF